jgi:alkylation response protein AidB-like acyl-CoA dehydrogenase
MPQDMPKDMPETDIRATARRLAVLAREAAAESEQLRHTAPAVAAELTRAGIYQLYLPASMGGPEYDPLTVFDVIEEISAADGSIGWNAMIANAMALNMGRLPAWVGRELAGTPADYRAAGSARPGGKSMGQAWPVPGGYRVRGQWNFASGMHNARWFYCTCVMMDGKTPVRNAAGKPLLRTLWVPREQVTFLDTWHVVGMRGTGSADFRVDDVFVPAHRSALTDDPAVERGPLFNHRARFVFLWTPSAANALGIARGAIARMTDLAAREASTLDTTTLRDRPAVQAAVGTAEAMVSGARAYVLHAVGKVWARVTAGEEPTDMEIAQGRIAIAHAMHESVRAVDKLFHAAGTNAIYPHVGLERAFRDIHVAVQHGAALPSYYESAGKVVLGLRPTDPGW